MRDKLINKVGERAITVSPCKLTTSFYFAFLILSLYTVVVLFFLPLWFVLMGLLSVVGLGIVAFQMLLTMVKLSEDPMAFAQDMLKDIDMSQVMAMANAFLSPSVKLSGPLGAKDDRAKTNK